MLNFNSKVTRKILNYFFLNETKKAYVNELARIIEEDVKNVYRMLLKLENLGIMSSEFSGKERYFFTNKKNLLYKEYKKIFLKTAGIENTLKKVLERLPGLKQAYIFGSYAKGSLHSDSDIDLLLIGEHKIIEAQRILNTIQKSIGREINSVNMTLEQVEKKKIKNDQFIESVFSQKNIKLL